MLSALAAAFFIGCGSAEPTVETVPTTAPTAVSAATATEIPAAAEPTLEPTAVPETAEDSTEADEPFPATSTPIPAEVEVETDPEPAVELSPAELLISSFTDPIQTTGEVLVLVGQVLDANGNPVPNAMVEIWQTDAEGVYDHPQDPSTAGRDTTFQFFGSAVADTDGWYAFRTIVPGKYEPRPRHIHFKVKQDGSTLLTSQFYFTDDVAEVQDEGIFRSAGVDGDLLLLQLVQGEGTLLANGQIVVDTGIGSGELPFTPSQAEGPYYPVVTVAEFDNDLAVKLR